MESPIAGRMRTPDTITVKLDPGGRWHVSLLVDNPNIQHLPTCKKSVGLDVGLSSLLVTDDGKKIANPRHFKSLRKKLRQVQKALDRKQKGSNNRSKAREKVAQVHGKIADSRKDFLHKLTTQLVRENQTIVVEDLAVKNNVKNRKLAQSISDVAWGELVRQLDYKCQWYGRTLVKIDRCFPSSKRCGHCGHILSELPLSVREWDCPKCSTHHDRDINAAHNILAAGLAVLSESGAEGGFPSVGNRRTRKGSNAEKVCGANVRPDSHEVKGQLRKSSNGKKQKPKS